MTLCLRAKELLHVWSYDIYDMALSTNKQRRHMINVKTYMTVNGCKLFRKRAKIDR